MPFADYLHGDLQKPGLFFVIEGKTGKMWAHRLAHKNVLNEQWMQ
jgi:hypothetical protein